MLGSHFSRMMSRGLGGGAGKFSIMILRCVGGGACTRLSMMSGSRGWFRGLGGRSRITSGGGVSGLGACL